jgi:hypothetical protein
VKLYRKTKELGSGSGRGGPPYETEIPSREAILEELGDAGVPLD